MTNLTQIELNSIRELAMPALVGKEKFSFFSQQSNNQQVKQLFQQMSTKCEQKLNTLLNFM